MSVVTITPANGSSFDANKSVTITATVSDYKIAFAMVNQYPYVTINGDTTYDTSYANTIVKTITVPSNVSSFTVKAGFYVRDNNWDDLEVSTSVTYYVNAGKCGPPGTVSVEKTNVAPSTSVKLSWGAGTSGSGGNTISGYNVYRSTSAGGTYTKILSGVASPQYVTSPSTNDSYYYKITTYGTRGGESDKSSATATLTTLYTNPDPPTNLTINVVKAKKGSDIELEWRAPQNVGTNNSINKYRIYYKDSAAAEYSYQKEVASNVLKTTHTVGNTTGVTRYFAVSARGTIDGTESNKAGPVSVLVKGGTIKYHNGTGWVECEVYYHNGSQWVECEVYYHDGSSWHEVSS